MTIFLGIGGHFLCRVEKDASFVILAAKESRGADIKHKEVLSEMRDKTLPKRILEVPWGSIDASTTDTSSP